MKKYLFIICITFFPLLVITGNCDYSWQRDSAGRKCGGRAAEVIPGGRLGGDGRYTDSYGRNRIYGRGNDIYDDDYDYQETYNSFFNSFESK